MNFLRWLRYRFCESGRPWWGSDLRCRKWQLGPFGTDWQCVLIWNHEAVEKLPHIYEPDLWPGGEHHEFFSNTWKAEKKKEKLVASPQGSKRDHQSRRRDAV